MKKYIFILLFLISAVPSVAQWQLFENMPFAFASAEAVEKEGKIYFFGGEIFDSSSSTIKPTSMILSYDLFTRTWETVSNMEEPRSGFSAEIFDSSVYYFGGINKNSPIMFGLERYDFADSPYVVQYNINFNRLYHTSEIIGDILYMIGGQPGGVSSDSTEINYIAEFNLISNSLSAVFSPPFFTYKPIHQVSAVYEKNIYIFGGNYISVVPWIYRFDPSDRTLVKMGVELPYAKAGATIIGSNNEFYIIGGFNEWAPALGSVEKIMFQAVNTIVVDSLPWMNYARRNASALRYYDTLYVFGGYDENGDLHDTFEKYVIIVTGSEDEPEEITPGDFRLLQNYPNPFNPSTTFRFELNESSDISLSVYDISGSKIADIASGYFSKGTYSYRWNAADEHNRHLPAGIYFYRLQTSSGSETKKMVLLP